MISLQESYKKLSYLNFLSSKLFLCLRLLRINLNKNKDLNYTLKTIFYTFLLMFCLSCSDDEHVNTINIDTPTTYSFLRDGASTVSFDGQTTRIKMATELVNAMNDSGQSSTDLIEMYSNQTSTGTAADPFTDESLNASTKSIKSKVAASADLFSTNATEAVEIKAKIQSWIIAQTEEVFQNFETLAEAGMAGQIADGSSVRYVNSKGLEYNQAVNKSIIGALMIDQICNNYLSPIVLDEADNINNNDATITEDGKTYTNMEHKWDEAYGYLFGLSTDASDPIATLGEDSFLNKYLSRVNDDADFAGIANEIFDALRIGRAAIVAGAYDVRDEQAEIIKDKLAQVIAARAIYYLQNGKIALASQDFGGAFHDLSEGFGFIYSLRFVRAANSFESLFSSAEVSSYISQLMENDGFWSVSPTTLDSISEVIAAKFDFTVAQAAE